MTPAEAQTQLDERVREIINWHFSPETGCPFWLEWAGKKPETNRGNILELLGGYECRHIAVPLAKRDVPAADLQRMKAKGYI